MVTGKFSWISGELRELFKLDAWVTGASRIWQGASSQLPTVGGSPAAAHHQQGVEGPPVVDRSAGGKTGGVGGKTRSATGAS